MASGKRYVFLDVLRGIAVLWMIQVHVTNVFLAPELRTGLFFEWLNISNGFVAPAFLFCAGSGLWIALSRKGEAYLQYGTDLALYLRRLVYILFWAYLLHVPTFSLIGMLDLPSEQLVMGLQVDILQTIVYASLLTLVVFLLLRDLRRTSYTVGVIAIVVSIATVWVWPWAETSLPGPLAVMVTPRSPFPLLPWMAYLLMGVFVTGWFMQAQNKQRLAWWFLIGGSTLPFFIFMVKGLGFSSPWSDVWWQASPPSQLFRVAGILLAFGGLYLIESHLAATQKGRTLQLMGKESLFLYLSHLMIVYGNGPIITDAAFGFTHTDFIGVVAIWAVVTIPLVVIAWYWNRLKKERPTVARWVLVIQISWITVSFLVTPPGFRWSDLLG